MDAKTRSQVYASVDARSSELLALSDAIFDNPELGNEEFAACAALTEKLEANGFALEKNVAGLATAFKATWGNGPLTIALLCEYDALPDIGHACGHHMQGPVILGAAFALKDILAENEATVIVFGTPAEESTSGKLPMAAAGVFDGLDVAFMMHAGDRTSTDTKNLAMNYVEFTYKGKAAHAAVAPEKGINALYGVLSLFNGIGYLREHIRRDAKIHGIITEGGVVPNIVPERAVARFYVRAEDRVYLNSLVERVYNVARGAALSTGTELTIREIKAYDNKVNTELLNEVLMEEAGLAGAANIAPPRDSTGSSDFSCVTYRTPGTCLRASFVPLGTPSHSAVWVEKGKSPEAHDAVIFSAKAIAAASIRLARDPDLMRRIKEDFAAAKKVFEEIQ